MLLNRRQLLKGIVGSVATSFMASPVFSQAETKSKIRAVAFDGFPIFDPRPVFVLAESLFPGKGKALGQAWRIRQFQYQWLRALSGQYVNFWQATEDGLVYAAKQLKLDLTIEKREQLMAGYLNLKTWPDVIPALEQLKRSNIRMAFLSNLTQEMLHANMKSAGIEDYFEHAISTDSIRSYKPDPEAYQLGVDTFELKREEIAFVAFAGWDAAGAKWFGYPTFWVNRLGLPAEELGTTPDGMGKDLGQFVDYVMK